MSHDPRAAPATPELPARAHLDLAEAPDEETRDLHVAPGLRVTSARIDEVDSSGDSAVSIARESVERLTLDHGLASERPLVELAVGGALLATSSPGRCGSAAGRWADRPCHVLAPRVLSSPP